MGIYESATAYTQAVRDGLARITQSPNFKSVKGDYSFTGDVAPLRDANNSCFRANFGAASVARVSAAIPGMSYYDYIIVSPGIGVGLTNVLEWSDIGATSFRAGHGSSPSRSPTADRRRWSNMSKPCGSPSARHAAKGRSASMRSWSFRITFTPF